MALVYSLNNSATNVYAAKKLKENVFVDLVHKDGYGVTQHEETNVSTLRIFKVAPVTSDARTIGEATNGGWFDNNTITTAQTVEYDLNLVHVYDLPVDIPEVQQDMVPVSLLDGTMKNLAGRVSTEINGSTIAYQLTAVFNAANEADAWTGYASIIADGEGYSAIQAASNLLDDGDLEEGIQSFPFDEREIVMRSAFRGSLLNEKGVLVGGSNYAQSMLAKGAVSPEAKKEWGNMYCGEIDGIPCYIAPSGLWKRAGQWVGNATAFDNVEAIVCAASATDRGISTQDYVKIIDSPNGAGKRLQPKTRWGVNVAYVHGVVPVLKAGTAVPTANLTVKAVGSR